MLTSSFGNPYLYLTTVYSNIKFISEQQCCCTCVYTTVYLTYCDHIAAHVQVCMHKINKLEAILLLTTACYTLSIVGYVKLYSPKHIQ